MTDPTPQTRALGWSQTAGWSEGVTTLIRKEAFTVSSDAGNVDVRGDDYEAALLVNGDIAAFQWADCEGSVGQHLVRASNGRVSVFRESVETMIAAGTSLANHFSDALKLLVAGVYTLVLEEIPPDSYVVDLLPERDDGVEITGFYPGFGALVATQALKDLSPSRVDQLTEQIREGARPTIITLCAQGAWGGFIIDGHHKIAAYRRANVPAVVLNIIRLRSERLPIEDIMGFLPDVKALKENLRKKRPA